MRPTDLHFRNPKEATPGPIAFNTEMRKHEVSFGKGERFGKVPGLRKVGPGTYKNFITKNVAVPVLRPYRVDRGTPKKNCAFFGNHLVVLPRHHLKTDRSRRPLTDRKYTKKDRVRGEKSNQRNKRRNRGVKSRTHRREKSCGDTLKKYILEIERDLKNIITIS